MSLFANFGHGVMLFLHERNQMVTPETDAGWALLGSLVAVICYSAIFYLAGCFRSEEG